MRVAVVLAGIVIITTLTGCGGTPSDRSADQSSTSAIADAVKLIRGGHLNDAERRLITARAVASEDPRRLEQLDYYIATVRAYKGDLATAHKLIAAHAEAATQRREPDSVVSMTTSLAWLVWAEGDAARAAEIVAGAAVGVDELDADARRAWTERIDFARAFFLIDIAAASPAEDRSARAADAEQARGGLAEAAADHRSALVAYAALRAGDLATATAAARGVTLDRQTEPPVAWVVAQALSGADAPRAAAARRQAASQIGLLAAIFARTKEP